MDLLWRPLNLASACPPYTNLTACSAFGYVYLSLLVKLYGNAIDKPPKTEDDTEKIDFIVVGGGAAGCVVANKLSAVKNWKVLLLEAGPEQPEVTLVPALSTALLGSNIDWNYATQPNGKSCLAFPNGCVWPRGKTLGGSSSINSFVYVRGNRLDYDTWEALGNPGWGYKEVLEIFKEQEKNLNFERFDSKFHGSDGEQLVSRFPYVDEPSLMMTEGFNETGLPIRDFNGAKQTGTIQAQAISGYGLRDSAYTAFIRPIRQKRKNLTIRTNSEAIKVLIDEDRKAYGVQYVKDGKVYSAYASKEVVVSGGAINSPKLLLLSGIGPEDHLRDLGIPVVKDSAVGENLHDHLTFNGIVINLPECLATKVSQEEVLRQVIEFKAEKTHEGPLSANGPVNSVAFIKSGPGLAAPDVQIQVDGVFADQYLADPVTYDAVRPLPSAFYDALIPRTMNLVPKSRGRLLLNATNPLGPPLIYPNYLEVPSDLDNIVKVTLAMFALEDTEAFRSRNATFDRRKLPRCAGFAWGSAAYVRCLARQYTSSPYHPAGSCRMGPASDRAAVVDARLRVRGVRALRVVDASIMPVVVRGNTVAPSLMIGGKGARLLLAHWLGKEPGAVPSD